jgi:hypothetical protein
MLRRSGGSRQPTAPKMAYGLAQLARDVCSALARCRALSPLTARRAVAKRRAWTHDKPPVARRTPSSAREFVMVHQLRARRSSARTYVRGDQRIPRDARRADARRASGVWGLELHPGDFSVALPSAPRSADKATGGSAACCARRLSTNEDKSCASCASDPRPDRRFRPTWADALTSPDSVRMAGTRSLPPLIR